MNIKRFVASDMREALRAVRAELGPEAVMLSSRTVAGGVEVVAAVDYDDGLLAAVGDAFGGGSEAPETAAVETPGPLAEYRHVAAAPADEPDGLDGPSYGHDLAGLAGVFGALPGLSGGAAASGLPRDARASGGPSAAPSAAYPPEGAPLAAGAAPPARPPPASARAAGRAPRPAAQESAGTAPGETDASRLGRELKDLRQLLEMQLSSLAWNDLNRRLPARARMLRQLAAIGVDPNLARELADSMHAASNPRDAWRLPLRRLADRLPLASRSLAEIGGVYAFVGPTGVGKTTTIAKIAARYVLEHGTDSIALVSTDTFRIGARDQLLTYARILGTPLHTAGDARELGRVLDGLGDKRLVLIDTAGMSQRDTRLARQLATLRGDDERVRSVLVLSAATDRGALDEALTAFKPAAPKALVVTKVDEAALLGPVLSLAIESRLPIAYVSDGQRVPEDLHVAGRKRIWLLQTAVRRARSRPSQLSEDELAERFGAPEAVGA